MPGIDGLEVVQRLRRDGVSTPVVFLTARDAPAERVQGLHLGADDYITKPFSLDELLARIEAILRRVAPDDRWQRQITVDDLTIDQDGRDVRRAGRRIEMSRTEFNVLEFLMMNVGRVVSKQQILEYVWQYDFGGESTVVETYISYLRKKLDALGPPLIHTMRGVGYVLRSARRGPRREPAGPAGRGRVGVDDGRAGRVRRRDCDAASVVPAAASRRATQRDRRLRRRRCWGRRGPLIPPPGPVPGIRVGSRRAAPSTSQAARIDRDGHVVKTVQSPFVSTTDAFSVLPAGPLRARGPAKRSDSTSRARPGATAGSSSRSPGTHGCRSRARLRCEMSTRR